MVKEGDIYEKTKDILKEMKQIEDPRQQSKVKYSINEIVGLLLFATLGNANECTEIEAYCNTHEEFVKECFELKNGILSHDTF